MKSFLTHLDCTGCDATHSADQLIRLCPDCDKVLYARYDLDSARRETDRDALADRRSDMWRYFEAMPVLDESNIVSLGEGMTPILEAPHLAEAIGATNLVIKDEGQNPTGTFKSRGLSAAVSKAKELGAEGITIPTAGNAGGALAAYAARAGMDAHVFMPQDALDANKKEVTHAGGTLHLVDGLIGEAGQQSRELAAELGMFDLSTLQEPYRAEGKKTMGYEIAEQCGWTFPDAIIYPTGGGTGVVGIWKAIEELETLGWIDGKRPRFFCVQAEGCQPIVRAFEQGTDHAEPWANAHTIAHGMRVPSAIADYLILNVLRESGGGAIAVSDDDLLDHMRLIARTEGIVVGPEGGATAAAARRLIASDALSSSDHILLLNTGSGLKTPELM
ncbi:MAG: threonine synthase [Dehalococcoidia bacterium]|nr:threonine synthase [Dehalococcoidia bacterium]